MLERASRGLSYFRAGLAARRVARAQDAQRACAAEALASQLGTLRGLPQKVGQVLSLSQDRAYRDAFAHLRSSAPQRDFDEWHDALGQAWGCDPAVHCAEIETHGRAASLGQVHRARLHDGTAVAIKVRHGGVREAIRTDLGALGAVAAPLGFLRGTFDLGAYRRHLAEVLDEELDYEREATNQEALRRALEGSGVVVPRVLPELVREDVLVSTWEDGAPLEEAAGWNAGTRRALGRALVDGFFASTFDHGLMHADPHPGNYAYRAGPGAPSVVLYDHGCVHRPSERERLALLALAGGAVERDALHDPFPLLLELGFDADLLRPLRKKLAAVCSVLFEPFAAPSTYDLADWNRGARVAGILGEDRTNLRAAGPPRALFLLRAFEGLFFHLRELGEPVNLGRPLREALARHAAALRRFEPLEPSEPDASYVGLATVLAVRVREGGRDRVCVKLPARTIERLADVVDDDVRERIATRGVALEQLVAEARAAGYAPRPVFVLEEEGRTIEVRLE